MGKTTAIPVTPSDLKWAIKESGYSADEVATTLGNAPSELTAWQSGGEQPTLTEFRKLAQALKRTPATFLLPSPPAGLSYAVQLRRPPGSKRKSPNAAEKRYLREASRLQEATKWVARELGEKVQPLPRHSLTKDAEQVAQSIGERFFPRIQNLRPGWTTTAQAFDSWRSAVEALGILVLLFPMGKDSAQGFALWDEQTPAIAINTQWNDAARIFTLFHEFGHLLTRTDSVCLERVGAHFPKPTDRTERWCERFAAAIVIPWNDLRGFLRSRFGWMPDQTIEDLAVPRAVAAAFKVSVRAATIRLIERDIATWDLYSQIPPYADDKRKGGGGGTGRDRREIREDQYGARATDLFVRGLDRGVLGRADVLDYLDITDEGLSQLQGGARLGRKLG
jgi:Zn-dependent peptidase ImmA (M78 family)